MAFIDGIRDGCHWIVASFPARTDPLARLVGGEGLPAPHVVVGTDERAKRVRDNPPPLECVGAGVQGPRGVVAASRGVGR